MDDIVAPAAIEPAQAVAECRRGNQPTEAVAKFSQRVRQGDVGMKERIPHELRAGKKSLAANSP
jgi:hypothetical protein